MSDAVTPQRRVAVSGFRSVLPRRVPLLALLLISLGYLTAWSPNLLHVFGIHDDYEMLIFKNHGFLFHEAGHLFSIARPVSAILSNITLAPAESIADFRWARLFSVATVCFLGWQMMSICIHRLRIDVLPAAVIALGAFLLPPFIYSVLNVAAWAAHLVPIMIAFFSYEMLSQSNVQAIPFTGIVARHDYRVFVRQLPAYCTLSSVWGACLVLQLAFYDYPPNALIIVAFPVVTVLFSRAPAPYRFLLAVRDVGFVFVNLAVYFLSAKLIYLPFARWLTFRNSETLRSTNLNLFETRAAATYNYKLNTDPAEMLTRLREVAKVSGDLWFMPQSRFHLVVVAVLVLALLFGIIRWRQTSAVVRWSVLQVAATAGILIVAFLLSASAVLGAGSAVVSYRPIFVAMAIV